MDSAQFINYLFEVYSNNVEVLIQSCKSAAIILDLFEAGGLDLKAIWKWLWNGFFI